MNLNQFTSFSLKPSSGILVANYCDIMQCNVDQCNQCKGNCWFQYFLPVGLAQVKQRSFNTNVKNLKTRKRLQEPILWQTDEKIAGNLSFISIST